MTVSSVCRGCASVVTGLACLVLSARSAQAQGPAVPTPDTLGANFKADSIGTGKPTDFDFLEGKWNIRFQTRRPAGDFNPAVDGTWSGHKTHDGRMVEDEFSLISPKDGSRSLTLTYRMFSEAKHTWQMAGISVSWGSPWAVGETWSDAEHRYAVQYYGPMTVRIKYYDITPNHFLWRADASQDGGKTWLRDFWKIEATRAGQ